MTLRSELLDAVDALTLPTTTMVIHFSDDGTALCRPRVGFGPECGPEPHTHTKWVQHEPLLEQLNTAIRETLAARPGGGASLAHTRGMLDSDALYLFTRMSTTIADWARLAGAPHRGEPAAVLRGWYVAWAQREREEAAERSIIAALGRWAAQIRATLEPEETMLRKERCPNPDCTQGTDALTGNPTWFDRAAREERMFPLVITYRPTDHDPENVPDALAPTVQAAVNAARARCRACGTEWSARGLAWELEHAKELADA